MGANKSNRMRCLTVGCNPKLNSPKVAAQHAEQTGHRVAKWPVRSAAGEQKQRERNRANPWGYSRPASETLRDDEAFSEYADTKDGGVG